MADRPECGPIFGLGICGGALGLELGIEIAVPSYRTVCVVERETAVVARVAARIQEGSIAPLAVWDDVRTFDGRPWRGIVHLITAGFPCQPFSVAGKRKQTADERWIWPDIRRIIEEARPDGVFLENVPGLLLDPDCDFDPWEMDEASIDALGGMGTVLRDLAELGFHAEWCCVRASDVGAAHGRKRVFILGVAHAGCAWIGRAAQPSGVDWARASDHGGGTSGALERPGPLERFRNTGTGRKAEFRIELGSRALADTGDGRIPEPWRGSEGRGECREPSASPGQPDGTNPELGNSNERGFERSGISVRQSRQDKAAADLTWSGRDLPPFAPGPADSRWADVLVRYPWLRPSISQAEIESDLRNVADGLAALVVNERTGALRTLGNGVVPLQAAVAFVALARRLKESALP